MGTTRQPVLFVFLLGVFDFQPGEDGSQLLRSPLFFSTGTLFHRLRPPMFCFFDVDSDCFFVNLVTILGQVLEDGVKVVIETRPGRFEEAFPSYKQN